LQEWLDSEAAEGLDGETVIQWLEQARGQLPQDRGIAMRLASALAGFGLGELARSRVQAMVLAAPDSVELQNHWFRLCLDAGDLAAIEEQAGRIEAHLPAMAAWYRAQVAYREGRHAQVGPLVQQVLQHDPQAAPTRRLWADAAMQLKDFDTAVEQRRLVLQSEQEPGRRWELLIAATAAGQWAEVRAQARALGMELEDGQAEDSVLEEDWGLMYLRMEEEGRTRDVLARRTGPATARILQPSPRGFAQRVGDWVVFPPQLAEQPPEDEQELENYLRVFEHPLHVIESGGHGPSYMIDGLHPGEELLTAWRDRLEEEGWKTWQYSNDSYRITDPQAGESSLDEGDDDDGEDEDGLPGIYLAVSAPAHVPAQQIEQRVAALCKGHQLCWLELARAAGLPTEWHEAMQERYGL
jgi:tetratricopeptide (TPR) repeat protein